MCSGRPIDIDNDLTRDLVKNNPLITTEEITEWLNVGNLTVLRSLFRQKHLRFNNLRCGSNFFLLKKPKNARRVAGHLTWNKKRIISNWTRLDGWLLSNIHYREKIVNSLKIQDCSDLCLICIIWNLLWHA